ncbi:hypothetical protein [Janthinobacterium sp. UMAB-56]|uniref:hypothetical protein n=1 Tax=Janthinobacterium sp. UMAB-56 TaxID=1365361 RepID=UPI001C59CB27|nr:hypothetical protein [Janthinobacterium sp. UMAB-56]
MQELFKNTHDALMFAFNYSSQQYALSPMSKLMKGGGAGGGKGLVSLDGAGQSGIILARLAQMTPLERACITARYAPRYEECPCCLNKDKMTEQYREAIAELAEWALGVCTGLTIRNMRGAIIRSFFERGVSITAAAKELNIVKATAYNQKARIHKALKELDGRAQQAASSCLEEMCGEINELPCVGQTCPV